MLFKDHQHFPADIAAFLAECVVHPDPFTAGINPAAPFEIGQVARYGGLWQFEYLHQVADAQLTFGLQQEDDTQSDRIGEGFEGLGKMFHGVPLRNSIFCSEVTVVLIMLNLCKLSKAFANCINSIQALADGAVPTGMMIECLPYP